MRIKSLLSAKLFGTTGSEIAKNLQLTPEQDKDDMRSFTETNFFFWKAVPKKIMKLNRHGSSVADNDASLKHAKINLDELLNVEDPKIFNNRDKNSDLAIGLWLTLVFLCLDDVDKEPFAKFPARKARKVFLWFESWVDLRNEATSRIHKDSWDKILKEALRSGGLKGRLEQRGARELWRKARDLCVFKPSGFAGGY